MIFIIMALILYNQFLLKPVDHLKLQQKTQMSKKKTSEITPTSILILMKIN